jgi:predicted RNA-binding Zn ribbon-like protein
VRLAEDGARLEPERDDARGALGHIVGELALSMTDGTWERLRVCRRDVCRWAFYDASRNRSGHWCSMAVCGNRTKGRRFRARQGTGVSG